jgi:hypothetical protein
VKLNQTTNLRVEDYPDQAKWIGRLYIVLNSFFSNIDQILDSNIDFSTNIRSITKDFNTTTLTYPIKFAWPHEAYPPIDLQVCKAMADGTAIALIPAWDYNASTKEISVSALTQVSSSGASATTIGPRYKFTIRVTV